METVMSLYLRDVTASLWAKIMRCLKAVTVWLVRPKAKFWEEIVQPARMTGTILEASLAGHLSYKTVFFLYLFSWVLEKMKKVSS